MWNINRWLWYVAPTWVLAFVEKITGHILVGQQAEGEAVTYWWWEKASSVKKRLKRFD